MRTAYHHCPACHQDVNFVIESNGKRCPVCYAEFPYSPERNDPVVRQLTGLGVLLLVLLGVPALFLALAFIGCAMAG